MCIVSSTMNNLPLQPASWHNSCNMHALLSLSVGNGLQIHVPHIECLTYFLLEQGVEFVVLHEWAST